MEKTFNELLTHLSDHNTRLSIAMLHGLSEMTAEAFAGFMETWATMQPERRQKLLENLTEITEYSFEADFDMIFIMALDDPNTAVQIHAIKGLWENESTQLVQPFLYLLKEGQTSDVRAAAASALGKYVYLGEMEEIDAEIQTLVEQALLDTVRLANESLEVQRRAVESLAFSSREGIDRIIEAAYYHDDELMRVSAVFAMGCSSNPKWGKIVISELENDSSAVRFEAARACGELGIKSAVGRLIRMVNEDADPEVQGNAVWALGQIGGKKAGDALEQLTQSSNEAIREAAEEALEELNMFDSAALMFDFDPETARDALDWDDEPDDDDDDGFDTYSLN